VPGYLDRRRAAALMREQGMDALLLAQPESITYATGAFPGVATSWRRAGAAFLLIPSDVNMSPSAVVGDLQAQAFAAQSCIADVRSHRIWVETGHYDGHPGEPAQRLVTHDLVAGRRERDPRPAQYDLRAALRLLRDILTERGLTGARIGIELGFIPTADFAAFGDALPAVSWVDATNLVERLRSVKHPAEITKLRTAAELASAGIAALMRAIAPTMTSAAMTTLWREAVNTEAARRNLPPPQSSWAYIAVGGDGFAPGGPVAEGDLIKIDVGCIIDGYSSDGARTAVLGKPTAAARKVHDALHRAFDAGLDVLSPGASLGEVYRAVAQSMWDQGYTTYGRGHFGHGVGASIWSEEWPFIAAGIQVTAEPGMVLAFETPYYIDGLGGVIIEDQLLVTESGIEVMAPLPRHLIEIVCR
jgi:Xaa-Pro dipeptidase